MPEKLYEWILAIAVAIISYFIKALVSDLKDFTKKQQAIEIEVVRIMDKVSSVEMSATQAVLSQGKLFEARMASIEDSLKTINNTLVETQKILTHLDKNQAVTAKSFELIMDIQDRVTALERA